MFGSTAYASEQAQLLLHPGDLEMGVNSGRHAPLDFEADIFAALLAGLNQGVASAGFAEAGAATSGPDFAGAVYRCYSGPDGTTVLARVLGSPSTYASIAMVSVEVGYGKRNQAGATAARTIVTSIESSLRNLNTLGSVARKATISQAMKAQAKVSLG